MAARAHPLPRQLVQHPHIGPRVGQHQLRPGRPLDAVERPLRHELVLRQPRGWRWHGPCRPRHSAADRLGGAPGRQLTGGGLHPDRALPPHLRPGVPHHASQQGAERGPGLDRLQLLRIADQHHLGLRRAGCRQHPLELPRAHHPGLVDHQDLALGELLPLLLPGMLQGRDRPARDARADLQPLGGNAGQGGTPHPVAGPLPGLAREAEQPALAAAGKAHQQLQVPIRQQMGEGRLLLDAELGCRRRVALMGRLHPMLPRRRQHRGMLLQPPLGGDHLARAEPLLTAAVAPQTHQLGRAFDPCQHGRELRRIAACAGYEPGQIAPGEGRLVLGQHGQSHRRIGDDALRVARRHLRLLRHPPGPALGRRVAAALDRQPARRHSCDGRPGPRSPVPRGAG